MGGLGGTRGTEGQRGGGDLGSWQPSENGAFLMKGGGTDKMERDEVEDKGGASQPIKKRILECVWGA